MFKNVMRGINKTWLKIGAVLLILLLLYLHWVYYQMAFYFGVYYVSDLTAEEKEITATQFCLKPEAAERVMYVNVPHEGSSTAIFRVSETPYEFIMKYSDIEITDAKKLKENVEESLVGECNVGLYGAMDKSTRGEDDLSPSFRFVKNGENYVAVVHNGARHGGPSSVYNRRRNIIEKTKIIIESQYVSKKYLSD